MMASTPNFPVLCARACVLICCCRRRSLRLDRKTKFNETRVYIFLDLGSLSTPKIGVLCPRSPLSIYISKAAGSKGQKPILILARAAPFHVTRKNQNQEAVES